MTDKKKPITLNRIGTIQYETSTSLYYIVNI